MITNPSTLLNKAMSLISIEQFEEFAEDYPELAQCYDLYYEEELIGDTCPD